MNEGTMHSIAFLMGEIDRQFHTFPRIVHFLEDADGSGILSLEIRFKSHAPSGGYHGTPESEEA
jgi:hypothetical protein